MLTLNLKENLLMSKLRFYTESSKKQYTQSNGGKRKQMFSFTENNVRACPEQKRILQKTSFGV
jgi:hypothetical protein